MKEASGLRGIPRREREQRGLGTLGLRTYRLLDSCVEKYFRRQPPEPDWWFQHFPCDVLRPQDPQLLKASWQC